MWRGLCSQSETLAGTWCYLGIWTSRGASSIWNESQQNTADYRNSSSCSDDYYQQQTIWNGQTYNDKISANHLSWADPWSLLVRKTMKNAKLVCILKKVILIIGIIYGIIRVNIQYLLHRLKRLWIWVLPLTPEKHLSKKLVNSFALMRNHTRKITFPIQGFFVNSLTSCCWLFSVRFQSFVHWEHWK